MLENQGTNILQLKFQLLDFALFRFVLLINKNNSTKYKSKESKHLALYILGIYTCFKGRFSNILIGLFLLILQSSFFFINTIKKISAIKKTYYPCTRNEKMIVSYWRNGRAVECGSLENC